MSVHPAAFADVAVPVPLRATFSYAIPPGMEVALGSRVAVSFHGRKTSGYVVALRDAPPEGVKNIKPLAGLLETRPTFGPELLAFLLEAARYYLHPPGEVLRAASPPLPTRAMRELRQGGFLGDGETLSGRRVAERRQRFVVRTAAAPESKLGPAMRIVLAELEAQGGERALRAYAEEKADRRAIVRKLAKLGLVRIEERETTVDPFFEHGVERSLAPLPSAEQAAAMAAIGEAIGRRASAGFLLHGVTGSGKTEVYLAALEATLAAGRSGLMLVPEIALTPQLVERVRARFGDALAVLHSELSDRRRADAFRGLRDGRLRIAVGARSALFAPLEELGLVIVDEEHDASFKQEDGFRYHARDMALLRAARAGAVCVLGSATPSLEAFELAQRGRLSLLRMVSRPTGQALPSVEVVDLRRHRNSPSGHKLLSAPLHRALGDCLEHGSQAMLFLNRRGFAPSLRCERCDQVPSCPACDLSLTEHRRAGRWRCHTCDFSLPISPRCPSCGAEGLLRVGTGTETLEDALATAFPSARIGRLDRDAAEEEGSFVALERMRRRELDFLVGTQMITKGHDLPGVSLVGVVLADQSLGFPDFRASERTFQLVAQVAGRAGRADTPGRVVVQTYEPEVPAIALATRHDYLGFYEVERAVRREHGMPPYGHLVAVRTDAGDEAASDRASMLLAEVARAHPAVRAMDVSVLGPSPAPIARARGRYRHRFLLRGRERGPVRAVAQAVLARIEEGVEPARASLDVDPGSML